MIVPTLALAFDAEANGRDLFDPYQGGDDERHCYCDTAICHCAAPMNGISISLARVARERAAAVLESLGLDDLPF